MKKLFEIFGLTENEIKVYKALLELKKGTKTPIVRKSGVLSSKIYEVLDRLVKKGLVASFVENGVKNYVPVHPSNVVNLFDEKIKEINLQKEQFEKSYSSLFPIGEDFVTEAQLFRGWKGIQSVFNLMIHDLKKGDTYYILGATPGEDFEKAVEFFSKTDKLLFDKKVKIRAIGNVGNKKESEWYLKEFGGKNFEMRYYKTVAPFEIGITSTMVAFFLLERNPICILINNKKIRDSFLNYFETLWGISLKK